MCEIHHMLSKTNMLKAQYVHRGCHTITLKNNALQKEDQNEDLMYGN